MKPILAIILLVLLAGLLACGEDGDEPGVIKVVPEPPINYTREGVLAGIERACNQRNIARYEALLDDNFTFYLTDADVLGGLPETWTRADEIQLSENMFSTTPPPGMPRCRSMKLDIQWESNLTWIEASSPEADETWYVATLFVYFEIDVDPDITFISNTGTKATFTVRNAGTDTTPDWRLVELQDLGGPSGPSLSAALAGVEPSTWGHVKSLFLPLP